MTELVGEDDRLVALLPRLRGAAVLGAPLATGAVGTSVPGPSEVEHHAELERQLLANPVKAVVETALKAPVDLLNVVEKCYASPTSLLVTLAICLNQLYWKGAVPISCPAAILCRGLVKSSIPVFGDLASVVPARSSHCLYKHPRQ